MSTRKSQHSLSLHGMTAELNQTWINKITQKSTIEHVQYREDTQCHLQKQHEKTADPHDPPSDVQQEVQRFLL
jgi:hypothetical protein